MAKSKALAFDRMALEAALREHPGDPRAAASLIDWLQEFETTPFGARRIVVTIIREATEARECKAAEVVINDPGSYGVYLRWRIYRTIGMDYTCKWPILVVPGGAYPSIRARHREPGEITELLLNTWSAPGGDRRWDYRIEVGCKWIFREKAYRDELAKR